METALFRNLCVNLRNLLVRHTQGMPPRNPSVFLTLRKMARFQSGDLRGLLSAACGLTILISHYGPNIEAVIASGSEAIPSKMDGSCQKTSRSGRDLGCSGSVVGGLEGFSGAGLIGFHGRFQGHGYFILKLAQVEGFDHVKVRSDGFHVLLECVIGGT